MQSEFDEHQRRRWMRPNAHLYIRHDVHRLMPPGSPIYVGEDVVKYFWPEAGREQRSAERNPAPLQQHGCDNDPEFDAELLRLRCDIASLRLEWELLKSRAKTRKYSPNQPRVPAGNPDGGQWTSEGGDGGGGSSGRVRLAAGDKPRIGPAAMAAIMAEAAKRAIDAYRNANGPWDLFGRRSGTVSYTELDGEAIYGSNSMSPTYNSRDLETASRMRDVLVSKYPQVMNIQNIGARPNDAVFHAEATALLRAANSNGGTLVGKSLEIYSDRYLCWSCGQVLPRIGLELGDPTVTFIQPNGQRKTMRNGAWVD